METLRAVVSFALIAGGLLLVLIGWWPARRKPLCAVCRRGCELGFHIAADGKHTCLWCVGRQIAETKLAAAEADLEYERRTRNEIMTDVLDAFHGGPKVGDDTDGCEHWDWTAEHIRSRLDAAKTDYALGLLARVRGLEEAIEPFASYGRRCPTLVGDGDQISQYTWFDPSIPNPTVGDARKAAAVKDKRG